MSLGATLVLLGIVGFVVVLDLVSVIKKFDQQIEKNSLNEDQSN